jgi:hypothetical protein
MRREKRWRYYCDHCKKSGGHAYHLRNHEKRCTANPDRECGICEQMGELPLPIKELIAVLEPRGGLERLRDIANNCPACILAAIRQSGCMDWENPATYYEFDFNKELAGFWAEVSDGQEACCH